MSAVWDRTLAVVVVLIPVKSLETMKIVSSNGSAVFCLFCSMQIIIPSKMMNELLEKSYSF